MYDHQFSHGCQSHGHCHCINIHQTCHYQSKKPQSIQLTVNNVCPIYNCQGQTRNSNINIDQQEVIDGLLKYNSSLTRYLSKYNRSSTNENKEIQTQEPNGSKFENDKYISIVKQKNLNFGVPDDSRLPNKQKEKEDADEAPQKVEIGQQTSPRNDPKKKNSKGNQKNNMNSNSQKISEHLQKLRHESRYLPDTGFRKYFNRQCFENYGRQNTNGVADGIVYGNYLKTFNINPHCGANLPTKQQTYEHALVSADPTKFNEYKTIDPKRKQKTQRKCQQSSRNIQTKECEELTHQQLEKGDFNLGGTLDDNQKHNAEMEKYKKIKLVKKNKQDEEIWEEGEEVWEKEDQKTMIPTIKKSYQNASDPRVREFQETNNRVQKQMVQNNEYRVQQSQFVRSPKDIEQAIEWNNHSNKRYQQSHTGNIPSQYKKIPSTQSQQYSHILYNPPIIQKTQSGYSLNYHTHTNSCLESPEFYNNFKQFILQQSFKDGRLAQEIINQAHATRCQICAQRQFTKCCCYNAV